jgi:dihydrofolate reductase
MTTISLIAALDDSGGIGSNNQLLAHLPADLNYFKSITMGKPIIMGRLTYESIGKPLPGRRNIVISSLMKTTPEITVVKNLVEALELTNTVPEVLIIGGGQLFADSINSADRLYITRIHHRFNAEVHFPPIDTQTWLCKQTRFQERDEKNQYDLSFSIFERIEDVQKSI